MNKGGFITLYKKLLQERKRLVKQINSLESIIKSLPQEDIFCARNGKYFKWYQTDGKHQTVIPKKDRAYAQKLAKRKYLSYKIEELQQEVKAVDAYLTIHKKIQYKSDELYHKNAEYANLLSNVLIHEDESLEDWMNASYEKNPNHPENLVHKTITGEYVRSKSEEIIVMCLHTREIPFRYECALELGAITFYPDFTIRHPATGEIYYWEHFGMIDNLQYYNKYIAKMKKYIDNGIIPTIHLIVTYETQDYPLDSARVMEMIDMYFV